MAGNRLGPKNEYIYQTDVTGLIYIISRDADLAVAGLGVGAAAPDVFDPENPPAGTVVGAPKNFTPRTVFCQSPTDGARKELIAFAPSANLYASTQRTSVPAIDGDATFVTTGRKGEKLSF